MTINRCLSGAAFVYVLLTVAAASETMALPSAAAAKHAVAHVAERANPYLQRWGYAATFATVAIEAVEIPAPGHTMVIASALAAARGTLDIRLVVLTAAVGTVLGSQIAWIVGARASEFLRRRSASLAARLTRTERLFRRWGAAVVVLGPFVEGVRHRARAALVARAIGIVGTRWRRSISAETSSVACPWSAHTSRQFVLHLLIHNSPDADTSCLRQPLQPGRNVDPCAPDARGVDKCNASA